MLSKSFTLQFSDEFKKDNKAFDTIPHNLPPPSSLRDALFI